MKQHPLGFLYDFPLSSLQVSDTESNESTILIRGGVGAQLLNEVKVKVKLSLCLKHAMNKYGGVEV
jgi:hypothetical protein